MTKPEKITNLKLLSNFLRCETSFIEHFIEKIFIYDYRTEESPSLGSITIRTLYIPKKRSGFRTVYKVENLTLTNVLNIINDYLKSVRQHSEASHGFIPKRNIKTNAAMHLAKKEVLSVDIKDFFNSITIQQVEDLFITLGFSENISRYLGKIVTLQGRLPQGYKTSPIISNFIAYRMDCDLAIVAGNNVTYTRYVDDLYFSTDGAMPILNIIENVIISHGFELNHEKTKLMKRGGKQYVTGLSIFDSTSPRISKKIKRNLRLEIYYINKYGFRHHVLKTLNYSYSEYIYNREIHKKVEAEILVFHNRIIGWLRFMLSVEPQTARKMLSTLRTFRGSFSMPSPKS